MPAFSRKAPTRTDPPPGRSGTPSSPFTYEYLSRLLERAGERFAIGPLSRSRLGAGDRVLLLRHDVDVSLERALALARIEAEMGVAAAYMLAVDGLMYRLDSSEGESALREIAAHGHQIGLHLDVGAAGSWSEIESRVEAGRDLLRTLSATPVRAVSFHRPQPEALRGPLYVAGLLNAYAEPLMRAYVSDSAGRWRVGDPIRALEETTEPVAQLLVHPIWWGSRHQDAPERLQGWLREQAGRVSADEASALSRALERTLGPLAREGATEDGGG